MTGSSSTTARPLRTGVIGLGMIGGGVATSLARSGMAPTAVFDVRPGASDDLEGVPAQSASPAAVADASDVVLLAVLDDAQARDVLTGDDGIFAVRRDGLVVVLLSTVPLEAVRELGELCAEHGAVLLDAGVTGGAQAADNGLVVMVGGTDEAIGRALPSLEGFAKSVVHCGGPGTGMATKIARNAVTYGQWAIVHEAASVATAAGVPLDRLLAAFEEGNEGGSDRLTMLKLLASGIDIPADRVKSIDHLAQKDLAAAQDLAGSLGLQTPLADIARARIRSVYGGELDEPLPEDQHARGLSMMDRTYGPGYHQLVPEGTTVPSIQHTVDQLFAEVWSRPHLSVRDRRLFTLGATAMLGRADLIETQLRGALANRELTTAQLRELAVHAHYYTGWGNGTNVQAVVEKLIAEQESDDD